ncbi:hypothetical protein [Celeribacter neptunius]|uniref:Sulfotransferase family protein n=1 Tax=Celeribacter neptunius TaxID=588602 RepID=A0A1I3SFN4_9RHOB|nr:hypothetical protein [Celeribacter neptunius]SFJ56782.1 hypothetical protein SAMN04487991_2429 [Celeribacter neptunius]
MSDAARILLHVGYHKTATTWMQKHLFMPAHGFRQLLDHQEIFDLIVKPHGLRFDPEPARTLIAERLQALEPGEVPVISSEVLSGHPFQGGHESDVYAERLARIAPGSRILLSIRDQMHIIPSVYMQYLQRGGTMPFDQFFEGTTRPGYFGFTPEHFEYDLLVAHYQTLFGAESIYMLTQESLKQDMDAAATALAEYVGATGFHGLQASARKVHAAGYPEYSAPFLRRANHVQTSTLNPCPILSFGETPAGLYRLAGGLSRRWPVAPFMKGKRPVSAYVAKRFAGRYTENNRRLAKIIRHPLDLSQYC